MGGRILGKCEGAVRVRIIGEIVDAWARILEDQSHGPVENVPSWLDWFANYCWE